MEPGPLSEHDAAPGPADSAPGDVVGVVVMSYGTPARPEDVEEYYTHIRRGRPPTQEQLADLRRRYDAIGGISPMAERTRAQVAAITAALESSNPGRYAVVSGSKHAAPFVEDAVEQLADLGVRHIVGVVLAPHYSRASVGEYMQRAASTAQRRDVGFSEVPSWHTLPAFVDHQARSLRDRLASMPAATKVLFTAHSLPERVLVDDPYPAQLLESATLIADAAGLGRWSSWALGWQSAGRTPEPWRGPDVLEVIDDLAGTGRSEGIVVVPQGFTSDHLEVLHDLDIEAARAATAHGLAFARTEVVNDDAEVMAQLAGLIEAAAP